MPKAKVDVKNLRLLINILRRAALDYLDPKTGKRARVSARSTLFGIKESPMCLVCETLKIDSIAAKLTIIQWRCNGWTGDPIFSALLDPDSIHKFSAGEPLNFPTLKQICGRKLEKTDFQQRCRSRGYGPDRCIAKRTD